MKTSVKTLVACTLAAFAPSTVWAGSSADYSNVTNVIALYVGQGVTNPTNANVAPVFFYHNGARTGSPPCATNANRYVLNPFAKAQIATLLTAKAMNKRVAVSGMGTCDVWSDTETVSYILVED